MMLSIYIIMGILMSTNREAKRLKNIDFKKIPKRTFNNQKRLAVVTDVYDGDTINIVTRLNNSEKYAKYSVRVSGVDTPEIRPSSAVPHQELHKKAGLAVKKYIENILIPGTLLIVKFQKEDKYGRLLGTIFTTKYSYIKLRYVCDINITAILLKNRLAMPYEGKTKCQFTEESLTHIIKFVENVENVENLEHIDPK
jgi:endonuclease YncB( thermonuclease family)